MPAYTPHSSTVSFSLPLSIIFLTLGNATRYIFEHSLLADQVDSGGWNAFEEAMISQKGGCLYKARLDGFHLWAQTIFVCAAWALLPSFVGLVLSSLLGHWCSAVTSSVRFLCPARYICIPCTSSLLFFLHNTSPLWLTNYVCLFILSPHAKIQVSSEHGSMFC